MALQEIAGERQPVGDRTRAGLADQEARQGQQPVAPAPARRQRQRPAGPGRDVGERVLDAGGRAFRQVEAEAKLLQQAQLPAHIGLVPARRLEGLEQGEHGLEHGRMGLALRQRRLGHGTGRAQARKAGRVVQKRRGDTALQLANIGAEMLGEPRPPPGGHPVARLVDTASTPARAAVDQPQMAPVRAGEQGHDGRALAVLARR